MLKSIQLVKQSTIELPGISSYKLVVSTANAQNMPDKVFVKQRVRNFAKDSIDDTFVAVCTPVQLEDFEEDAPGEGSSYFRSNTIELIGRTPEYLTEVFDSLMYEVKKLVIDLTDLDSLSAARVYTVAAQDPVVEATNAPTIGGVIRTYSTESMSVTFTPGAPTVGGTPLDYQYSLDGGASWFDRVPRSTTSPLTIYGLNNESTYNLKLRAYLGGGKYGSMSSAMPVNVVLPPAAPTAPEITDVVSGNTQLSIAFNPPVAVVVENYEYSVDAGAHWTARSPASTSSPLVITGLNNGTEYTVKIRGINTLGYGVSSVTATGTPLATFWTACSAGAGISQINDLILLETNWKKDTTGAGSTWGVGENGKNINLGAEGTGSLRLRCCYKNENNGSHDNEGYEYPAINISQLSATFSSAGYFRMSFNGKQLFNLTSDTASVANFSYYPAGSVGSGGFGNNGRLGENQTGLIDLLIESSNVNISGGSVRFNMLYD